MGEHLNKAHGAAFLEVTPDFSQEPWWVSDFPEANFMKKEQLQGKYGRDTAVAILAVNEIETLAVLRELSPPPQPGTSSWKVDAYFHGNITAYMGKIEEHSIAAISTGRMGAAEAILAAVDVIKFINPRYIIAVGVAWGKGPDGTQLLGDVLVATTLVEFADNTKVAEGLITTRSELPSAGRTLRNLLQSQARGWKFPRPGSQATLRPCKAHFGALATGGILLNNKAFKDRLLAQPDYQAAIGGEMEAWGIHKAVDAARTSDCSIQEWMVVKGICDWGFDKVKGWQPLAAAAAADLVFRALRIPNALHKQQSADISAGYQPSARMHLPLAGASMVGHPQELSDVCNSLRSEERAVQTTSAAGAAEIAIALPTLHEAAAAGLLHQARAVLGFAAWHPALQTQDEQGKTPLYLAAQHGHVPLVECLLHFPGGLQALSIATQDGWNPLHVAAFHGHAPVVAQLLQASLSPARLVNLQTKDGFTALMLAALEGDAAVVQVLLETPACRLDVISSNSGQRATALSISARDGHSGVIRQLLQGLQPAELLRNLCYQNQRGATPLQQAVVMGNFEAVELLLSYPEASAALSLADQDGNTPLHQAATYGYAAMVPPLLQAQPSPAAFINEPNKDGFTPLMLAAEKGHAAVVEELLNCPECRLDFRSGNGDTASSLAKDYGHSGVARLILQDPRPKGRAKAAWLRRKPLANKCVEISWTR